MDAIVDGSKTPVVRERDVKVEKPSREEAEAAVRTYFMGRRQSGSRRAC